MTNVWPVLVLASQRRVVPLPTPVSSLSAIQHKADVSQARLLQGRRVALPRAALYRSATPSASVSATLGTALPCQTPVTWACAPTVHAPERPKSEHPAKMETPAQTMMSASTRGEWVCVLGSSSSAIRQETANFQALV